MTNRESALVLQSDDIRYLLHCLGIIATRIDGAQALAESSAELSRTLGEIAGAERAMRQFLGERLHRMSSGDTA
jgi:hypothetical protein